MRNSMNRKKFGSIVFFKKVDKSKPKDVDNSVPLCMSGLRSISIPSLYRGGPSRPEQQSSSPSCEECDLANLSSHETRIARCFLSNPTSHLIHASSLNQAQVDLFLFHIHRASTRTTSRAGPSMA